MSSANNKLKYILIAVLFLAIICFNINNYSDQNKRSDNLQNINEQKKEIFKACFKDKCFAVEVADTPQERAIGLMNREYLDSNSGMLFLFDEEAEYVFWMKNTLIPLDIIWLDQNKKVIFIKHNAEPCQIGQCEFFKPSEKAKYVLEIGGGLAKEIDLREGNTVGFTEQTVDK